jgi:hypothetical protein
MLGKFGELNATDLQAQAAKLQGPFSLAMGVFTFGLKIFDRVKAKKPAKRKGRK